MNAQIAVAASSFHFGFPALVYAHFKRFVRPDEAVVEWTTLRQDDPALARQRLLAALAAGPRPTAVVGICIHPDEAALAAFESAGIPVVLVDEEAEGASTVAADNFAGGYIAGVHLARAGRRAVAVVCGDRRVSGGYNAIQRVSGFAEAMAEHQVPFAPSEVLEVREYTSEDGMSAMSRILAEGREVDAVFCAAGDACAAGLLAVARERGVRVPEQLAVVGYDDNPVAAGSDPPLTTVRQPVERIAREAHRLATAAAADVLLRPRTVLFEPTLVRRGSG